MQLVNHCAQWNKTSGLCRENPASQPWLPKASILFQATAESVKNVLSKSWSPPKLHPQAANNIRTLKISTWCWLAPPRHRMSGTQNVWITEFLRTVQWLKTQKQKTYSSQVLRTSQAMGITQSYRKKNLSITRQIFRSLYILTSPFDIYSCSCLNILLGGGSSLHTYSRGHKIPGMRQVINSNQRGLCWGCDQPELVNPAEWAQPFLYSA